MLDTPKILFSIVLSLMVLNYLSVHLPVTTVSYIILLGIHFLTIAYGCLNVCSNFYVNTICSVRTEKKQIAITFDDGPVPHVTSNVLDILREYSVTATFFCIGNRIPGNENLLIRMDAEGHLVGNHTFSHSHWWGFYSVHRLTTELNQTEDLLLTILGKSMNWFRPPFGITTPTLKKVVNNLNYTVIGWNQRSFDTIITNEKRVLKQVTQRLQGGDIILFHDSHPRIVTILPQFIQYVAKHQFSVVRLDELLKTNQDRNP